MTNEILFTDSGIYVPQVYERVTLWRKDKTGDPLVGVNVANVQQAQRFGNVFIINNGMLAGYLEKKEGK